MFLILARDLGEFRRTLVKLTKQSDEKLENIFARWKKILEPNQVTKLHKSYDIFVSLSFGKK